MGCLFELWSVCPYGRALVLAPWYLNELKINTFYICSTEKKIWLVCVRGFDGTSFLVECEFTGTIKVFCTILNSQPVLFCLRIQSSFIPLLGGLLTFAFLLHSIERLAQTLKRASSGGQQEFCKTHNFILASQKLPYIFGCKNIFYSFKQRTQNCTVNSSSTICQAVHLCG